MKLNKAKLIDHALAIMLLLIFAFSISSLWKMEVMLHKLQKQHEVKR